MKVNKIFLIKLFILTSLNFKPIRAQKTIFATLIAKIEQKAKCTSEELYDRLWPLYQNPLDLNKATHDDLVQLNILNKKQINDFLIYMSKNAPLLSLYEIQAINSWDPHTISLVKHFLKVEKQNHPTNPSSFLLRKQKTTIYFEQPLTTTHNHQAPKNTLGSTHKILISYTNREINSHSIGFSAKKNNQEPITHPKYYYIPSWSAHIMQENYAKIKKIIVGHYQVGFGQGLITKSKFNIDKNAEAIYILRANQQGIEPNNSFSKKNGLQGIATQINQKDFQLHFYASKRKLDAKLYQGKSGEKYVRSITTRGVDYNNQSQLEKKDTLEEQILGTAIVYNPNTSFELGIQALDYRYNHPIKPKKNYYNSDYFKGKHGYNLGAFSRILWKNAQFFSEVATSKSQGKAILAGTMASLNKWLDIALLWRYYTPDFHAIYGKAFGRNTHNKNEHGIYLGMKAYPTQKISIASYIDLFKHQKPQYRAHTTTQGTHWLCSINYQPQRKNLYQLKIRTNQQPYNRSKVSTPKHPLLDTHQRNTLNLKLDYLLNPKWQARTQAQIARHTVTNTKPKHSFGAMQTIVYKKNPTTFKAYLALFNAKQYGTRIYFYIPNFMPGLKYPMLYGTGIAFGLSLTLPFNRNTKIAIQFLCTCFTRKGKLHIKPKCALKLVYS